MAMDIRGSCGKALENGYREKGCFWQTKFSISNDENGAVINNGSYKKMPYGNVNSH